MRLVDPRRLMGRNVLLPSSSDDVGVGGTLELQAEPGEDAAAVDDFLARVEAETRRLVGATGLPGGQFVVRRHAAGATVGVTSSIDALGSAIDLLEWAAVTAGAHPVEAVPPTSDEQLTAKIAAERNPALIALLDEARRRDVPVLLFDDGLSLGHGQRSRTWPAGVVPAVSDVDWNALGRVPVALVTGTNGKTTTTRYLARMGAAAGRVVGSTSTDGVVVDGALVHAGDWSGPGGARAVLRHERVQAAVLETARGGLLRRGLAVDDVDVAVITNVSDDHLGEYGIHTLDAMADVKCLVGHGVSASLQRTGRVVLNAADARLVARAARFRAPVVYFSVDADDAVVTAHVAAGGTACVVTDGAIVIQAAGASLRVIAVDEIPLAFGGAARHNVENALAAVAAGHSLGFPVAALAAGLRALLPSVDDAHGRSVVLTKDGVRLLVDFAHNPAGVAAAMSFVQNLRARDAQPGRLVVLTGAAGDRVVEELRGVAQAIAAAGPDRIVLRDLPRYLRGRAPGEVPAHMRSLFIDAGVDDAALVTAADDVAALTLALDDARPGDTIAHLIHVDGPGVAALLQARGWR